MRTFVAAFLLVLTAGCAAQAPAPEVSPAARRDAVAHELMTSGCTMPNAPQFRGQEAVVARELEARYRENEAGFIARDPDRVMRLRHPAFYVITPDGQTSTREQMYERTRQFIGRVERFDCVFETITALTLEGDTVHAIMDQRTVRHQRLPDGTLQEVRTWVVQRESWKKVDGVWMFWRVDNIQPNINVRDGVWPPPPTP